MLSSKRICAAFADVRVAQGVVIAFAVLVGGCSADVTRFDFPVFGLTDKGDETGSLPTPPESIARRDRELRRGPARRRAAPASAMPAGATRRRPTPPAPATGSPTPATTGRRPIRARPERRRATPAAPIERAP